MTQFLRSRIMIAAKPQYSYLAGKQSALTRSPDFYSSIFTHGLGCRRRLSRIETPSLCPNMPEDCAKHSRYAKTSPLRTILELMGSRNERTNGWNNIYDAFAKTRTIGTNGCRSPSSHIINGRTKKIMAMRNKGKRRFKTYNKGDQFWVEGTNIKTLYPSAKLSPKRYGPFKVLEQLSDAVYQLEIPRHW